VPEAYTLHARTKPRVLFLRLVVSHDNSAGETYHDTARGKGIPSYKGHRGVENEAYRGQEMTTPTCRTERDTLHCRSCQSSGYAITMRRWRT
jgi:hypothetical protein